MKKILVWAFLCFLSASFLGAGTIRVLAPAGGERLTLRSSFVIQWEATDVSGNFNVVLMREGAVVGRIATGLASGTRSFTWTVGELVRGSAEAGSGYRIRVAEAGGAGSAGQSRDTFSIVLISGSISPPLERRTVEPAAGGPSDYSVASLAFKDFRGNDVMMVNSERIFLYNGVATPGTAIVRVRWNGSSASPPDPPCDVPVEVGIRYLGGSSHPRIILGSYNTGPFDRDGICQISVPFVVRAGERGDTEVNIDMRLLPRRAGCDANPGNNSLAYDLRLRPYESEHDLRVQILPDFALTQRTEVSLIPNQMIIRGKGAFRVRDFPSGPGEPLANVRCEWSIRSEGRDGEWHLVGSTAHGFVTVRAVGSSDWTAQELEFEFPAWFNWQDSKDIRKDVRLYVEVDCDNRVHDIDRRNNLGVLPIKLVIPR